MPRKIKIAYLDYSHIFAGAERVLSTIISYLDRTKYEPILIFPYPMEHQKAYDPLNCEKIYLTNGLKWWMGRDRWRHPLRGTDFLMRSIMGWKLALALRRKKIGILHVNLLRPDSLMWILPSKRFGIKVMGHFRSQSLDWIPPKKVHQNCDLILCVSEYSKSRLLTKGQYTDTRVLYDSINTASFSSSLTRTEAKRELGVPDDSVLLLSVGQLSRHKGHDNAIRAFAKVAPAHPKSMLYIAGGGQEIDLNYLKRIVSEYPQIQNRVLFSEKQLTNMADVYNAADLVLSLTKVGEAFGLVPYEAAMMKVPFIAPDKGAVKEFIIDGENGLLVDTNNVDAIAAKIEWAITHHPECERMNARARQVIADCLTPQIMVENLEAAYEGLLSNL